MTNIDLRFCTFSEYNKAGFLTLSPDCFGGDAGSTPPLETMSPYGLISRPRDPQVGPNGSPLAQGACNMLVIRYGGQDFAIPCQDPRSFTKLPKVAKGGSMLYAILPNGDASFMTLNGDDGSFQVYVPHGDVASTMTWDTSDPENVSFQLLHGEGMGITIEGGGKFPVKIRSLNNIQIVVNNEKILLIGDVKVQGSLDAGGDASVPLVKAPELIAWITTVLVPALSSLGVTVQPPTPATIGTLFTKGA